MIKKLLLILIIILMTSCSKKDTPTPQPTQPSNPPAPICRMTVCCGGTITKGEQLWDYPMLPRIYIYGTVVSDVVDSANIYQIFNFSSEVQTLKQLQSDFQVGDGLYYNGNFGQSWIIDKN